MADMGVMRYVGGMQYIDSETNIGYRKGSPEK